MAIIVDSGVVIAGERGTLDLERWLDSQADQQIAVAAITVAELWHGVERATAAYRTKREQYVENVLATVEIVPYTAQTARQHARLWAYLESTGQMIGDYDLIVAATALEWGGDVATLNKHHFSVVRGLNVIEPF